MSEPGPGGRPSVRPGRWAYGVAVLVFVASLIITGLLAADAAARLDEGLHQAVVPGQAQLHLEAAGSYTIFYEYRSMVDGRLYATDGADVSELRVALESRATGDEVALAPPAANVEYTFGERTGTSVLAFSIDEPGAYVLSGWYPPGVDGPEVVLAIGQGVGLQFIGALLAALGILMLGSILALVIALLAWRMRRRSNRTPH
jgi:hypothetical protein